MSKAARILAITLSLLLVVVIPAAAITWGEPDAGEHPYVGFMIFFDPYYNYPSGGWFSCSGTLLDETTLLTAGHCTYGVGTGLEPSGTSGGRDMWVTFVETKTLDGFPWDPDPAVKNVLRFDWLQAHPNFTRGTAIPHPDYADFAGFPNTRDVGLVLLDTPYELESYGVLPALGQFDYLDTAKGAARDRRFTVVGYGIQGLVPPPFAQMDDDRYKGETTLTNTRSVYTSLYNFQFTNSPGKGNGSGGTCFGDSGGPVLWADTNTVAAITSFGITPYCTGLDFSYRADISETLDFVGDYLGH